MRESACSLSRPQIVRSSAKGARLVLLLPAEAGAPEPTREAPRAPVGHRPPALHVHDDAARLDFPPVRPLVGVCGGRGHAQRVNKKDERGSARRAPRSGGAGLKEKPRRWRCACRQESRRD